MIEYDPAIPKSRYNVLKAGRDQYVTRAEDYSKVTLSYIMPDVEDRTSSEVQNDFNSEGAALVNHLGNRYVQELFPTAKPFFRLRIDEFTKKPDEDTTENDALLAIGERRARWAFEQREARPVLLDALQHCIVTGNGLVMFPPDGAKPTFYALDEYVIQRSPNGDVLEIITEETKAINALSADIRDAVIAELDIAADANMNEETATIYTYIRIDEENPDNFLVDQSVESIAVGDEHQSYPKELLPWIPLVWKRTRREHYGRGLVEDHYGSFWALSVLTEALITGAAVMTDIKYLVRPGSVLDVVAMNSAATGTYHYGSPDDVGAVQTNKQADFQFIAAIIADYKKHLGKAFLMISSQIRDSERTTAEENRIRAQELDQSHGGTFSNFASTLQSPIARLLLRDIDINIKGSGIEPVIVTGLDAMGRSAENEKIRYLLDDVSLINNVPEEFRARLRPSNLISVLATGRDVEYEKWVMTEEEFLAEQQAAQEAQAGQMAGEAMLDKADASQIAEGVQQGVQ